MPLVSVILPTRDRPALLPRALASVLAQTHRELEVIVVDNNRGPAVTANALVEQALRDPRVRVLACPQAGNASQARNAGLALARGEWISYLDDDDAYAPTKLAEQLARANATGAILVVCGYTVMLPRRRRTRQTWTSAFSGDALLLDVNWGTPLLFHRRDDEIRFSETLMAGHDTVFAHQLMRKHDVRIVPNCARSLVDVYPQVGATRVHADGEAIWRSHEMVRELAADRFTPVAWRAFMASGALIRAQFGYGSFGHFLRCAWGVARASGPKGVRSILNAVARRLGWFKDWVVS